MNVRQHLGTMGSSVRRMTAAIALSGALAAACSGANTDVTGAGGSGNSGNHGGGGGQTTSSGGGGSAQGGSGGTIFNPNGGGGAGGIDECAKEAQAANLTPVDLVIMLDQSGSMDSQVGSTTIWGLVTDALTDFVQGSGTEDMAVGLQYFPLPDGACTSCDDCFLPDLQVTDQTTNDCCCSPPTGTSCALDDGAACPTGGICFQGQCYSGGNNATCETPAYAALEVPIAALPGNASAVVSSLAGHSPKGLTPTAPALQGAIAAAAAQAQAKPDHVVAVVLASDGVPTECAPQDIDDIASLAAAAFAATPSVRTYVIGIGNVSGLNAIAEAGGTEKAFLVSANGNAGQQFLDAMTEIKGSLLACEFDIPEPSEGQLDYTLVNVQFTQNGGTPEVVPQVPNPDACGGNAGWYYDDPVAPKKIVLCDATCDLVKASAMGAIEIVLGCATIVK